MDLSGSVFHSRVQMGYFWSKPEPVNVDYESEPESEMESTREMMNNWKRYNSVKKELEARGAKTFGSLERMEQRLQRFLDMETKEAEKAARRARVEADELLRIDVLRMSRELSPDPVTPPQSPRTPTLPPLLRRQNARDYDDEYTDEQFLIDQVNERWVTFTEVRSWNRGNALDDVMHAMRELQEYYDREDFCLTS
jgi:hypothetical protein